MESVSVFLVGDDCFLRSESSVPSCKMASPRLTSKTERRLLFVSYTWKVSDASSVSRFWRSRTSNSSVSSNFGLTFFSTAALCLAMAPPPPSRSRTTT